MTDTTTTDAPKHDTYITEKHRPNSTLTRGYRLECGCGWTRNHVGNRLLALQLQADHESTPAGADCNEDCCQS